MLTNKSKPNAFDNSKPKFKQTAINSAFAIGGVSFSTGSFVVAASSVLCINICGKKFADRKFANSCALFLTTER